MEECTEKKNQLKLKYLLSNLKPINIYFDNSRYSNFIIKRIPDSIVIFISVLGIQLLDIFKRITHLRL